MILVRNVFHAKYGRGDELVALCKEATERLPDMARYPSRILTDASGTFFTVVWEQELPSLAEWERVFKEAIAKPEIGEWFGRSVALVESGYREFYNIER